MILYIKILEIITFLVGLIFLKKINPTYLKLLVLLLVFTCLNESIFVPFVKAQKLFSRVILYNVFSFIDMVIWMTIFFKMNSKKKIKIGILVSGFIIVLYSLIELIFLKSWKEMHTDSFRLYSLLIILLSVKFFYDQLSKEYYNFLFDPLFYIAAACIIYHGVMFLNITTQAENKYWKINGAENVFFVLQSVANTLYYVLLCTSFTISNYYSHKSNHQDYLQD